MVDQNTAAKPYVEVVFKPNTQVRPDVTQIDGAFFVIPRNFAQGVAGGDSSFKAFLADDSGSMDKEGKRRDCAAGIQVALRTSITEEDYFAVYAFSDDAKRIFPPHGKGKPVLGTKENIANAIAACESLKQDHDADTRMSTGIELVLADFLSLPDCDEATCAMPTDGFNKDKDEKKLRAALAKIVEYRKQGKTLKIQPIAVGDKPSRDQLNQIVEACLADPAYHIRPCTGSGAWADVASKIFNDLSAKRLRSVTIRFVDKPQSTTLIQFLQQRPTVLDLTSSAEETGDGEVISIQTGAWEDSRRLYSFSLGVKKPLTCDSLVAGVLQISYKIGRKEYVLDAIPIKVHWTNVDSLSRRIPAELAEARGITGSVTAISAGIAALEHGDKVAAREHFQKAYDLAKEANDLNFIRDLGDYMEIDEQTGRVTVKTLTREDSLRLDSLSKRRPGEA
jgi:hypothetical protein